MTLVLHVYIVERKTKMLHDVSYFLRYQVYYLAFHIQAHSFI